MTETPEQGGSKERRHLAQRPSRAACSIALPKITDEMVEVFHPWLIADDGDGYTWNQAAVDFACVLKTECFRRSGKQ